MLVEEAKVRSQYQRIQSATYSVVAALETSNEIVQRSKQPSVTEEELRSLARIVRAYLALLVRQMQLEEENLATWRYGRIVRSPLPADKPRSDEKDRNGLAAALEKEDSPKRHDKRKEDLAK